MWLVVVRAEVSDVIFRVRLIRTSLSLFLFFQLFGI